MGLPERIAGYEIEDRLGQGGMGTVYLARDPELGRRVALKLIQAELDSADARERFTKEARSIAALNHPNIVTLYHSGHFESRPFLVLEYIEGRSVATIIRNREPAPVAVRLRWLEGLCDGLQFAHDRGIIHRDIKPANLMIDHLDRLRILDFGIARIAGAARTQYSGLMGTPAYMAPEYVRGEEADYRADIFAAGAVAYELLTFEPAFPGKTHATIIHRVMECAPPTFVEVGAVDVDPQLEQIILGALQKNPGERFQTAREFGEALRAVRLRIERTGDPVPAPHSATVVRVPDSVASDATWHVPGRDLPPPSYTVPMGGTLGAGDVLEALEAGANRSATAANTGEAVASHDAPSELVDRSSRRPYAVIAAGVALAAVAVFAVVTYLRVPEPSATLDPPPVVTETPPPVSETTSTAGTGAAGASSGGGEIAGGSTAKPPTLPPPLKPTDPGPASGGGSPPVLTNTAAPVTAKSLFDGVGAVGGATNPGLLYRVFRLTDNDTPVSVDPETTTFRTGKDRVRFAFQPNVDGFLYVAQEATNGRWDVLFPDPDINGGRNDVESFKTYMIPSDSWFNLSPPSGTDKVFVFLSKTRVVELPGLNRPVTSHETLAQADVNKLSATINMRVLVLERTNLPQSSLSGGGDATYVVHRESLAGAVTVTFNVTHK